VRWCVSLATFVMAGAAFLSPTAAVAAAPLPTPTKIVVSNVQYDRFSLSVGGSTTQFYSVYLNGLLRIGLAESSATKPIVVSGLNQNTRYDVQVQRVNPPKFLNSSALSRVVPVTTSAYVAPTLPPSPANVAATGVTNTTADLTWNAVPTAVSYRVYLNGILDGTATGSTYRIEPTPLYPNGFAANTGLNPGRINRLSVAAVNAAGGQSIVSEITVQAAGAAAAFPSTPGNLTVGAVTNRSIALTWTESTIPSGTTAQYQFIVNGIVTTYTCQVYCFGTTAGTVGNLAPGTTYRLGVRALDGISGTFSDWAQVTATTSAP
jgi:Fibronectin type III domain